MERVVREEWECLDGRGEVLGGRKVGALGKRKVIGETKTNVTGKERNEEGARQAIGEAEDDDYELV